MDSYGIETDPNMGVREWSYAKGTLSTEDRSASMMDTELTNGPSNGRVALFIDVDNVLILSQNSGLPFRLSLIIDRVRQQGTLMSAKAYADWTSSLLQPFLGDFRASAIELVQLPISGASKEHKNTADIQLAVDALEMVFLPGRPDIVVIVGGDRDYVPLVQRLKRYGVFVLGIGVEAGVSAVLAEACDSFVYYDNMVPPTPEDIAEPIIPDREEAYTLLLRAVDALNRDGRRCTGASVHAMMNQLSPTFDLARYKTTFKNLAQDAQQSGYVTLTENPGSDFLLTANSAPGTVSMPLAEAATVEYDFSTPNAITSSYRTILQEHRIPLLPWTIRRKFVELIWEDLNLPDNMGRSMDSMRQILMDHVAENRLPVSQQMLQKLLYSLNFAQCFKTSKTAPIGRKIEIPYEISVPLYPVSGVDETIDKVHRRYLEILAEDDAILDTDAVFDLLYGAESTDDQEVDERRKVLDGMCQEIKPLSTMARALMEARRQG